MLTDLQDTLKEALGSFRLGVIGEEDFEGEEDDFDGDW